MYSLRRLTGLALCLAALLAVSGRTLADTASGADEIVLKSGSRILGTITAIRGGVLSVKTEFADTVDIDLELVETLRGAEPATLLLTDDSVVRQQPLRVEGGRIVTGVGEERPLEELSIVNPEPWELGQGYNWSGLINFAFLLERGNTDSDQLDYKLETEWRSTRDRFRVHARGEYDKANDIKTADNWLVRGKWDYFLEDPNYWGFLAQAEEDEFRDLDLRWLAGPYVGRQIFDDPMFTLAGEFGLSYVTEEFIVAQDQDYPAANWDIDITSDYLGGESRLYLHQFGLWNLDETSDVVIDTTLGLSFPLLFDFEAAAEILWEYDSGAVDGVDELDETYAIRIGYTW